MRRLIRRLQIKPRHPNLNVKIDIHFLVSRCYHLCMSATKQLSVRIPTELVSRIEAKGPSAPFVIEAIREKLDRDEEQALREGFALLAESPEMVDMEFPTGAQANAVRLGG